MRDRLFIPRIWVKSYDEADAPLLDGMITYGQGLRSSAERERAVWERLDAE